MQKNTFLITFFPLHIALCIFTITPPCLAGDDTQAATTLTDTITRHDITWTLDHKVPVGQFVNGDYFYVGPATVIHIEPAPTPERNGSMLNLKPTGRRNGYDARHNDRFDDELRANLPIKMKPGDSLMSSISCEKRNQYTSMLWPFDPDKSRTASYVKTVSVLTCMDKVPPADAFRPPFSDTQNTIYRAGDLRRELLQNLKTVDGMPTPAEFAKNFERCWSDIMTLNFCAPALYAPQYGRETARAVGMAALILNSDFPADEKETLLINFVQYGLDIYGNLQAGFPGWGTLGGHGQGRKLPLVFAGIMLDDEAMARPDKTFPDIVFQQDNQTVYAKGWTGAEVVWAGHLGKTGWDLWPDKDRRGYFAETTHPKDWPDDGKGTKFSNPGRTAEGYRRCCTSHAWIAQALALEAMNAQDIWNHTAFFDYCDRWMTEDDTEHLKILTDLYGRRFSQTYRQGTTWDPWVDEMYRLHRNHLPKTKKITFSD